MFLFFFFFFRVVSSLSQDSLIQSSSVLSPFDPFLATDRSYTTCFRSNKVRNAKLLTPETKRNRGTFGLRDQRCFDSRLKHNILGSSMNTNGWIIAWTNGGGVSAFLYARYGFFHFVIVQVLCYNKYT